MPDLEERLRKWRQEIFAGGITNAATLDELESHLRDDAAQQMRFGVDEQRAFELAVQHLGTVDELRHAFNREQPSRTFLRILIAGASAFAVGIGLCYFVMLPWAVQASTQYSQSMGMQFPYWAAGAHAAFAGKLMLTVGLIFGCAGCLLWSARCGILRAQKLAALRSFAIVINLVLGALLSTPEVVTQLLMFVPLQLVYEATVWMARYVEKRRSTASG